LAAKAKRNQHLGQGKAYEGTGGETGGALVVILGGTWICNGLRDKKK
jgi:hypothetical protein